MVNLTIDGKEVQVPEGTNIIEAAKTVGIEIPHYCYHPGLHVVGQCRICFVAVEGMPKLVTACSTPVREGMVVSTDNDEVVASRAAVMEFLLANHPLDCPVCDQAGECYLQDYSVEHGLDTTHMVDERRTFPSLERRMIGPHVVQNMNRCISCTQCIRFTQEISETHDLTMKKRGNHQYIDTFDGGPLDNPWSACVADVCPVGALTVKEFRFRARVWHLEETDSICPGCSIGCNVTIGHLKKTVHRYTPRHNAEVNGWWMCNYGRFSAETNNQRAVDAPRVKGASEAKLADVPWQQAIEQVATIAQGEPKATVIASANLANEALFLVKKVLVEHLGLDVVVPVHVGEERKIKNGAKEWVTRDDAHANALGATLIGLRTVDAAELEQTLADGTGPLLILDASAHPWLASEAAAEHVGDRQLVVLAQHATPLTERASILLPLAAWAEAEGTYTSSTGRVQLARQAYAPSSLARPAARVLAELAVAVGAPVTEARPRALFELAAAEIPAFAGMTYRRLITEPGIPVREEVPDVG